MARRPMGKGRRLPKKKKAPPPEDDEYEDDEEEEEEDDEEEEEEEERPRRRGRGRAGRGRGRGRVPPKKTSTLRILLLVGGIVGGVFIVGCIGCAVIMIPSMMRARITANEASCISSLRTINTAEQQFKSTAGTSKYATLEEMVEPSPPFVDSVLGGGTKSGYSFDLVPYDSGQAFTCRASPTEPGTTGNRHFFTDSSGVIRVAAKRKVDGDSTPID